MITITPFITQNQLKIFKLSSLNMVLKFDHLALFL